VKHTSYEAPHFAVFSSLPPFPPFQVRRKIQERVTQIALHECIIGRSCLHQSLRIFHISSYSKSSRDSSVGIALGYGLDDRGSRARFPAEAGNFSLHHRVQNSSGFRPASSPMDTMGSFHGGKEAGSRSSPLASI
jgi:hypothetical protein